MKLPAVFLLVFDVTGLPVVSASGQVIAIKTMDRFYDPVEMRAEVFPKMHNLELDHLELLACHDGKSAVKTCVLPPTPWVYAHAGLGSMRYLRCFLK